MAEKVKEHSTTIRILGKKDKSVDQSIRETQNSLSTLEHIGSGVFDAVATAAGIAASAIGAIGGYAVSVGSAFEEQMSTVEAISGATAAQMDALNEKALEVSATSSFTASDVGKAYEYMSMAGWDAQQQLEGVASVMNLAAASGEELGTVSDIVTDQITAFGLTASDTAEFTDVLAAASSNSNTNVAMMGETFQYAGAIAGSLGYSIQDVALATGLMANASIKSSQAGTSLRKIMTSLTKDVQLTGKAFAEAGQNTGEFDVKVTNDDGSMKSLVKIIDNLREGFSQLSESEKSINAKALVGTNAMTGLLTIVNASEKDYKKLKDAIEDSAGATERMADIRLDNLSGDVTLFTSQMEALGIKLYDHIKEPIRETVQSVTASMGEIGEELLDGGHIERWLDNLEKAVPIVVESFQEIQTFFSPFTTMAMEFGEFLLDNPEVFVSTLTGIGAAMVTYKIARNILGVVSAVKSFISLTNPLSATLTVAGLAVGVIAGISTQMSLLDKEARQADLAEHFGDISLSMKEVQEIASDIVSSGSLDELRESVSNLENVEKAKDKMNDITSELNKMNWKVSIGLELSEEEKSTYKDQIENYVNTMQQLVEDHHYSVTLSASVLLGESNEKDKIVGDLNSFYLDKESELSEIGRKLSKAVTDAFSDNLLDFDEVQKLTELQQQMAEIQSGITTSNFSGKLEVLGMEFEENGLNAESFQKVTEQINEEIANAEEIYKESLAMSIASLEGVYEYGSDEYNKAVEECQVGYDKQLMELKERSAQFLMNQVEKAYGDTVTSFNGERSNELRDTLYDELDNENSDGLIPVESRYNQLSVLDKYGTSIENVSDILSSISDITTDVLLEYDTLRNAGEDIPETLQSTGEMIEKFQSFANADRADSNSTIAYLNDFFNTYDDLYERLEKRNENKSIQNSVFEKSSLYTWLSNNIKVDEKQLEEDALDSYDIAKQIYKNVYNGGIDLDIPIRVTGDAEVDLGNMKIISNLENNSENNSTSKIPVSLNRDAALPITNNNIVPHADGGIFNTPHYGVFAENGPESFIPLKDKNRGTQVWIETGKMLGLIGSDSTDSTGKISSRHAGLISGIDEIANETVNNNTSNKSIQFSPVINVSGSASSSDVQQALQFSFEQFKQWYEECEYQKSRTAFR